jgi:hypothetical protein
MLLLPPHPAVLLILSSPHHSRAALDAAVVKNCVERTVTLHRELFVGIGNGSPEFI